MIKLKGILESTSRTTKLGNINDPNSKFNKQKMDLSKWNEKSPEDIMRFVYWSKGQVPPTDKRTFEKEWKNLKKQLEKKFPVSEDVNEGIKDSVVKNEGYYFQITPAHKKKAMEYLDKKYKKFYKWVSNDVFFFPTTHDNEDKIYRMIRWLDEDLNDIGVDVIDQVMGGSSVNEAKPKPTSVRGKFSKEQLSKLKDEYGGLNKVNPSSDSYKKLIGMLDIMNKEQLKQLSDANIKFVSMLARNRYQRK